MSERWNIDTQSRSLYWDCEKIGGDHTDFIEMSGLYVSVCITYGIKDSLLYLNRRPVFPTHRIFPNDTHGSWQFDIPSDLVPQPRANGKAITEVPKAFFLDGTVRTISRDTDKGLLITRTLFPSTDSAALCERVEYKNEGLSPVTLTLSHGTPCEVNRVRGPYGLNISECTVTWSDVTLAHGETALLESVYTARLANEDTPSLDIGSELQKRYARRDALTAPLALSTGNDLLDTMFYFAKLRGGESIFRTKNGDVHSPGGLSYYAAVWCNDQAEYAGPWQAWTGDELQLSAAYNAYAWYYPHMDGKYEPIPSSIIAEGLDFWGGAGDRGDAAMYLFGASRYALVSGRTGQNGELWKAIKWCAEYCLRKMDNDIHKGLIPSDSDELEGRLPSGRINLSTNMLALGGFRTAAALADELGEPELAEVYRNAARTVEAETEVYFAANIHGYDTYKYYEDNTTLRSWICLPLCMDIATRAGGTVEAITSPYLFSDAGQLSEEGTVIAWDRSTLYGLRGMYRAAAILSDKDPAEGSRFRKIATDYLMGYCRQRLLGDHVPYAVEAYPEGGQRHLSAESTLFCQIITEGILAVQPLGFRSFSFNTLIPEDLPCFVLTNVHAFGEVFDLSIRDGRWSIVTQSGRSFSGSCGGRVTVDFNV